jgi:hypothetical protein
MVHEVNKNSIIASVAAHNVRWIKECYYPSENSDEISVSVLISEITKYNNPQSNESDVELPQSLVTWFDKHYLNNPEEIDRINEAILNDFVQNKSILLIFENENSTSKRTRQIRKRLGDIKSCEVIEDLTFSQSIFDFVKNLDEKAVKPQNIDFVLCCLSKIENYQDIITKISYLAGRFGRDKLCVLYDNENSVILSFLTELNIITDSYNGVGITR